MDVSLTKIVVIPVYKSEPDPDEKNSFSQCLKVLFKHKLCLFTYSGLDISFYTCLLGELDISYQIEYFEKKYFENLEAYNRLMLSPEFYNRFSDFEYILVYQLDAWVFRDELDFWCDQGYDFIGAPWINMNLFSWILTGHYLRSLYYYHKLIGNGKFLSKIGNGGFSLRRVKAFTYNIKLFKRASLKWKANEDCFFAHYVKTFNPFFKIPKVETALKFSFDAFPQDAYKTNNLNLPFGCHGWSRSDTPYEGNFSFWNQFIRE